MGEKQVSDLLLGLQICHIRIADLNTEELCSFWQKENKRQKSEPIQYYLLYFYSITLRKLDLTFSKNL